MTFKSPKKSFGKAQKQNRETLFKSCTLDPTRNPSFVFVLF
jgi:hypothetical protein